MTYYPERIGLLASILPQRVFLFKDMANGWIKLHRKITDWCWYGNIYTKSVFLHLLITANNSDRNFQGYIIHRGQVVTSIRSLSSQLGMSEQNVRTALKNLQSSGDVTINTTKRFSVISVTNYNEYQTNTPTNTQTNTQPNTPTNTLKNSVSDCNINKYKGEKESANTLTNTLPNTPTNTPTNNTIRIKNKEERIESVEKKENTHTKNNESLTTENKEINLTPISLAESQREKVARKRERQIPSEGDVLEYAERCGYAREDAESFYNYYSSQDWCTSSGMCITNWYTKLKQWCIDNQRKRMNERSKGVQLSGEVDAQVNAVLYNRILERRNEQTTI